MKKGNIVKFSAATMVALSAITPVAAFASEAETPAGFYTGSTFLSQPDFQKMTKQEKKAFLAENIKANALVLVLNGKVYDMTNEEIQNAPANEVEGLGKTVEQYTAETGNKLTPNGIETSESTLTVTSVSAINANYVTVSITAPKEDLLGQTIEVKNSAGTTVEVKPLDIAAGDTTAEFEFATAVKAADLKGVWTVNGQAYDLDVFNKIVDVLEATNQIELNAALVALDLKNYDSANIGAYFTAQQKLVGSVEATELTLADIQKLIDDANAEVAEGKDEVALIKAIKDAHDDNNQVAYLNALSNAGLTKVNPKWVTVATNGYFANIDGTEADLKAIQAEINTANNTILKAPGTITSTGIDKAKLTASKELINDFAPLNDQGKIADSTVAGYVDDINEQLALVDVLDATTPTAFKNKYTALVTLVDNATTLDIDNYKDANAKEYIRVIDDLNSSSPTLNPGDYSVTGAVDTVDELDDVVKTVNTDAGTSLVNAVKAAADTDSITAGVQAPSTNDEKAALLKSLKDLGVKQVADSNIDTYVATIAITALAAISDLADAQAAIDAANIDAVEGKSADAIIAKLQVFGIDNIVEANAAAYATAFATTLASAGADNKTTVDNVKIAVAAVNKQVIVDTQVKAINKAEDVATVKVALDALADVGEVTDYLKIRSVDRDFVAAYVLEERPATPGYAADAGAGTTALDAIAVEVTNAQTAYTGALSAVNALTVASSIDTIVAALEGTLDEGYNALSNTAKVTAAEAFHAQLVFNDSGAIKTPFITLASVKALLAN